MSIRSVASTFLPFLVVGLCSCATVDQFGERIYDGNRNSQLAQNQETLVNIVRASNFQPLNFVGISQVTGGQSEQLNTGLPTITIGPLQTVAQHQFQITNSLQSGVTGGYQASPLVSTAFSTGMLSPISPKILAFLVASYPREPVFFSVIESITVKSKLSGRIIRLVNDPTRDHISDPNNDTCAPLALDDAGQMFSAADRCSYSLFINLLGRLTNFGLSAELVNSKNSSKSAAAQKPANQKPADQKPADQNAAADSSSSKSADSTSKATDATSPSFEGRLCFDTTISLRVTAQPQCGDTKKTTNVTIAFPDIGPVDLTVYLRSPIGVFNYYGKLLNKQPAVWKSHYFTYQGRNLVGEEPFLNIVRSGSTDCFASVGYGGEAFCVPSSSRHTALLMTLLLHLRNLNIQPSDLNSAFSVHLSGT
jgi:hypothetical protein